MQADGTFHNIIFQTLRLSGKNALYNCLIIAHYHHEKETLDAELHVGKVEEVVDVPLAGGGVGRAVGERLPVAVVAV